jgi:hypothetical protein
MTTTPAQSAEPGSHSLDLAIAQTERLAELIEALPSADPGSKQNLSRQVETLRDASITKITKHLQREAVIAELEAGLSTLIKLEERLQPTSEYLVRLVCPLLKEILYKKGYHTRFFLCKHEFVWTVSVSFPKRDKGWLRGILALLRRF